MNIANNDIYKQFRLQDPQEFSLPSDIELLSNAVQDYGIQFNSVYENAPNTKSDSNKLETALSLQTVFNIEPESAMKFAEMGLQAGTVEGKTHEAGYGEALVQTGKNTYHNFLGGMGYSLYMMTKNEKFKEFADNQNKNVVDLWEDYNWLGDTVLSSIQPLGSQARFMGTAALVQGVPTLVASAFGPAAAKITSFVSGLVAAGINFGMTGLSQQGSEFYQLSKLADQQGHKLDLESPDAMFHFYFGAIAKGGIETVGMELFPGMSFLRKALTPAGIQKVTFETGKKMLAEGFMRTGLGVIVEGGEEFQDSYHSSWQENALKEIANRQGADFDLTSSQEMVEKAWKEGLEGAKGMIIPSMLTGLVGGGAYGMRMRAEAKKGFSTPEGSVTVDLRAVKTTDVEFEETESTGKMEPFRASVVGDALIPVTEEDNRKAAKAKSTGMTAGQAIISDEVFGPEESFVNQAALATGAKLSGDTLVFNTQEELDRARFMLESVAFATESEGNTSSVTLRDSEGNLTRVSLSLIEEGQQVSEPDLTYVEDPEAPYALSRMTQDRAFEWQERQMIKESVGDVVSHTKGRISNTDLEASVDAIKLVADTLKIPTDQMLKDNLVFKLESASPKSERGYIENISVNGRKQYTIHISDKADATTILHEMGHFLRGTATREQLSEFSRYYGGDSDAVWIEDVSEKGDKFVVNGKEYDSFEDVMKLVVQNEERFADDFVSYLRTGEAPTEGLQNLFSRMRAVLSRFIDEFGYRLSPEVRQAFDNLIAGNNGLPFSGQIPTDTEGNVLFQQAPPVGSDEFKELFGDSKVVTKSGEPILVYHGSPSLFKNFNAVQLSDSGYLGAGFYFSGIRSVAESYASRTNEGYIYNAYLVMENPLIWQDSWDSKWDEISQSILGKHPGVRKGSDEYGTLLSMELREMGYDGVLDMTGEVVNEAVVFDDKQVLLNDTQRYNLNNNLFQTAPPTDSEAFKAWFGDSKVVGKNGEPLVVYHSTNTEFEAFDTSDKSLDFTIPNNRGDNIGAFFTTSARNSKHFGNNTMEVYLSIQNPKVFDTQDNFREFVRSNFIMEEETLTESAKFSNDTRRILEEQGYDGVIIKKAQFGGKTSKESWYVAFSSTQIKSVNNQGTWDAGNPNILFQGSASVDSKEFKSWFKKSIVSDENGSPKTVYHGSPYAGISEFNRYGANGGERGLVYATESESEADDFSYEQLPGSSSFTFIPGAKGEVYPLYMSIQKPLDFRSLTKKDYANIKSAIDKYSIDKEVNLDSLAVIMERPYTSHQFVKSVAKDLLEHLPEYGYDGLVAEMRRGGPLEYAVVSQEQIRSVDPAGIPDTRPILFQADGNPKLNTDFPKRDFVNMWEEGWTVEKYRKDLEKWESDLREWVDRQGDMLQFGNEGMVHVIHKNIIPDEKPWRSTTFINRSGEWTPTSHSGYNTKYEAVRENVGLRDYRPDILFQEAVEKIENGSLAVLHNISADKLVSADEIGGLPSPSLAITRPDIPFVQFGEITLIADPSVATKAMEEGRLYDRDVWSPTVPRAEWKINQKVIDNFDKKIMPVIYKETGKYFSGSDAFSRSDIIRGPNLLVDAYKRTIEAQIAFLKDRGIDYELKFKKQKPPLTFPMEVIDGNLEYFKSTKFETENSDTVREYLRPKVNEYLEKSLAHRKEKNPALYETMKMDLLENYLRFGVLDKVFNFAKTYDKDALIFDEYGTQDSIRQTIKDHNTDFTSWIKDNIDGAYTDPKIKIGSRKYDYNAENILEWMRSQSERASQDTMTYGPGKAASNAGRPFSNRGQVRDFEGTLITREAQGVIWEETIEPLTESIQNELPNYNNRYSTWESLDAIYEAIGNYITKYGSTGTVPLMRKELSAKSFTKVPTWLLEQTVLLARRLATLQQDYFEAKPNRVVSLDEFNSAIVPNTISEEQKAVLRKHNISLYEYDTSENRQAIVEDIYANKSSKLLFQLSPEAKKEFLKLRKDEVQNAVENFYWVPDEIVREYAGEAWADEEIATRDYLRSFPWMLEEARQFPTSEEFLDYIKEQASSDDGKEYTMTPTDEKWHRKVFAYSRIQSPEDRDKLFVKTHSSRQDLLGLAKSLSAYQDVGSKKAYSGRKSNQTVIYRWGAFKGVSNYVKWLTPQSTDEEFERARKLIQENPRPYRKAMQVVEQAQARVHELKGWESQNYEASRDAYYDALGEELQEALAEPLSLNEMTDREAAEYLRTTDDKKARFDARERLATHNGVYMMELQANAELKALAADRDKIIETEKLRADTASKNLTELRVKHNDAMKELRSTEKAYNEAKKEVEKLSGKLDKASEKARRVAQLERDLADRRARVKELRTSLTEANSDLRRSKRVISQYEIRESNRITREKIEQLQKQVIRSIRMSDAMDRAYAPLFAYVQNKLGLTVPYSKPDMAWKKDLSVLYEYLPEEVMNLLEMDEQIDNWTVEAMQALIEGMDLLGKQARREHVIRMDMQRERRDKKGLDYYRELYGTYQPQTDQSVESIMAELRNSIDTTNQRYINGKESAFSRMFHGFTQSFAHIWSLARWLDNWKEGVAYDMLVKEVWDKYQDEYKEIQRRTGAFEKVQQELGMSENYLAERIVEVKTTTGDTEQLTREQAITAYIYSLNEYSAKNLMEAGGNKFGIAGMTKIVQALDDKDIRFANAMLAAASNDAEYERVSEAFYRVYNHDLSQEENYFRMRAQGIEVDSVQNLATGPSRRPQSYVEKGFGVDRTGAVYPLNLNGVGTLLQTIREQEHLIAFGEWVRDMNYLLGPRGSMGHEISVRFGKTTLNTVQDYVNKIAGQQEIIADFEKLMNNLITQVSTSFISANLSSMLKQFASMSFALRGDISPKNFMKVMLGWSPASGIRDWKHAFDVMGDLDPSMRERTFDIETKRSRNLEYSNRFTRGMAKFRDIGIKYTTELGDSFVTTKLWWGAYLTGLEKYRDLEEEGRMRKAIFEASRFIAETQSSSNLMDLSPTQRSRHVWNRLLSQFKRDAFKRWNEIFWHIPYAARNKQWKEVGGIVVSNLMSMMVLAAVTGIFLKSEDDDKKKRANIILRAFLAQFMGEFVPYIGEGIQGGINGFSNNGLIDFNMDFGSFIGEAVDGDGFEKMWDRSWDLIVDGLALISVPSITAERIYKTIDERNFWRLLGGYWYKMKD